MLRGNQEGDEVPWGARKLAEGQGGHDRNSLVASRRRGSSSSSLLSDQVRDEAKKCRSNDPDTRILRQVGHMVKLCKHDRAFSSIGIKITPATE